MIKMNHFKCNVILPSYISHFYIFPYNCLRIMNVINVKIFLQCVKGRFPPCNVTTMKFLKQDQSPSQSDANY